MSIKAQYETAKRNGWLPHFANAAATHGFATADLMAIGSRESNMRNIKGDYHDFAYHGFGIMQLDIGSHKEWIESGAWSDPEQNIMRGAAALAEKREQIIKTSKLKTAKVKFRSGKTVAFTPRALTNIALRHCTLAAYNCGGASYYHYSIGNDIDRGTTGKNYGRDVMERASLFQKLLAKDGHVEPSKRVTVEPSDDKKTAPAEQSKESNSTTPNASTVQNSLTLDDVTSHVSKASAKQIAVRATIAAKAPIITLWQAGVHGKVLIILAALIIAGVLGFVGVKYWPRIKTYIIGKVKRNG